MSKALKAAVFVIGLIAATATPAKAWYFYSSGSGCWICNSQNVCDYVHDGNCVSKSVSSTSSARVKLTPINKAELERISAAKFGSEPNVPPAEIVGGAAAAPKSNGDPAAFHDCKPPTCVCSNATLQNACVDKMPSKPKN